MPAPLYRRSWLPVILGGIAFAAPVLLYAELIRWSHNISGWGPAPVHKQIEGAFYALVAGAILFGIVWGVTKLILYALSRHDGDRGDDTSD